MGDGLEAHHPEGGDVLVVLPDAGDLHLHQGDHQDAQEDAQDVAEDVHQHDRNQGNLYKYFCLFYMTKLIRNSEEKNSYIDIKEKSKGSF